MKTEQHLVQMANDIAAFFAADPEREVAVAGILDHLQKFWEPRMQRKIIEHFQHGGEGLDDLAREAVSKLSEHAKDPAWQP